MSSVPHHHSAVKAPGNYKQDNSFLRGAEAPWHDSDKKTKHACGPACKCELRRTGSAVQGMHASGRPRLARHLQHDM